MRAAGLFITTVVVFAAMIVIANGLKMPEDPAPFLPVVDREDPSTAPDDPAVGSADGRRAAGLRAAGGTDVGEDTDTGDDPDPSIPVVQARPVPVVTASPLPDAGARAEAGDSAGNPDDREAQRAASTPTTASGLAGTGGGERPSPSGADADRAPQRGGPGGPAADPVPTPTPTPEPSDTADPSEPPAASEVPTSSETPSTTTSAEASEDATASSTRSTADASEQPTLPPGR